MHNEVIFILGVLLTLVAGVFIWLISGIYSKKDSAQKDLYEIDEEWDIFLNKLISNYSKIKIERYTVFIDNIEIWIGNYPYSYEWMYVQENTSRHLPKLETRARLKDTIDRMQEEVYRVILKKAKEVIK